MFKKLSKRDIIEYEPNKNSKISGITGANISSSGRGSIKIQLDNKMINISVLIVSNIPYELILGIDTLKKNKIIVDSSNDSIIFQGKVIPYLSYSKVVFAASTVKTTKIAPFSKKAIPIKIRNPNALNKCLLIHEITKSPIFEQYPGLIFNNSLTINKDNNLVATLENNSENNIIFKKNQHIALAEVIDANDILHSNDENLFDGSEIETEHQLNHISDIKKRSEIQQLLEKYSGIFIESDKQLTESNIYQAHIDTGDALPVKGHYYRTPMKLKGEVSKQIDDMLSAGIISPSNSQWIAPIVLVKKKNGSYRMAIDYRRLNAVTKAFNFAMPQIHDIFAKLGGKKIFSVLDLKSGFYQISLSQDSRPKTGFACFKGCYHFNRVPFGVLNGTAYFNKAINIALGDAIENYAMAYIDDIIIYSNTWQEHMVHLQNVFKKLEAANLKLKKGKCTFASPKISFLGHVITENKLSIEEDKIKAIKEASPPTNVKEVRAFLGMAGFLRTFVKDFAKIATPLTNLTSKKVKFTWTDIHQDAFQEIKDKLTSKPVLALPQENNGQFKIYTDASIGAIGGVLMQTQNGEDKVIAYLSQKLSKSQTRWPTIQRELFAIMVALKKLEFYILGNKIDIFTDHKPLLGLLHSKPTNHVIERWLSNLSRYNFTLHYIKGSENLSADYLSRINPQNSNVSLGNATTQTDKFSDHSHKKTQTYDKEFPSVKQNVNLIDSAKHPERADKHHPSEQYDEIPETLQISNISLENILKEQLEDKFYAQIRAKIEKGDPKVNDFVLIDDLLYHIAPRSKHSPFSLKQLCISEKHEDILMNYCHEFSHAGITNTLDTYKKRFYSAKSNSKCVKVVQNCTPCKLRKLKKLESPCPKT